MMGRLIFADEIEKKVEEMYLDYRSRSQVLQPDDMILVDEKLTYATTVAKAILDMVKNTKTAYDTEKVVEQIENMHGVDAMYYGSEVRWTVDKAIEIVRKGGV